jgi:hypothetical protein
MTFLISALVAFLVITLGAGAYGVKSKKKPYKPYKSQSNIEDSDMSQPQPPQDYNCSGTDLKHCEDLLCGLGIYDKSTWKKWVRKNHPDKLMDKSEGQKKNIADIAGSVQNCVNSECFCRKVMGSKRKRNKSRKRTRKNKNKTRKTNKKSRKKSRK